jgi:hypothetical protein
VPRQPIALLKLRQRMINLIFVICLSAIMILLSLLRARCWWARSLWPYLCEKRTPESTCTGFDDRHAQARTCPRSTDNQCRPTIDKGTYRWCVSAPQSPLIALSASGGRSTVSAGRDDASGGRRAAPLKETGPEGIG